MQQHKVEILLPKFYNDNTPVEGKKYAITYREIFRQFDGCTEDSTPLVGAWRDPKTKKKYHDTSICYWVICIDSRDNMSFLDILKEKLKDRFKQEEILIYYTTINVV